MLNSSHLNVFLVVIMLPCVKNTNPSPPLNGCTLWYTSLMERLPPDAHQTSHPEGTPFQQRETPFAAIYDSFGYHWTPKMAELAAQAAAIPPVPELEDPSEDPARDVFAAFIDEAQRLVDEINQQDISPEAKNRAFLGFQLSLVELAQVSRRLKIARHNMFDLLHNLIQTHSREDIEALVTSGLLEDPEIPGVVPYSLDWQALGGVYHPEAAERMDEFRERAVEIVDLALSFPESLDFAVIGIDPQSLSAYALEHEPFFEGDDPADYADPDILEDFFVWPKLQSRYEIHLFQRELEMALLEKTGVNPRTTPVYREYTTRVYKTDPQKGPNPEISVTVYEIYLEHHDKPLYLHHIRPVNPRHTQLTNPVYPGWAVGPDIDI